MFDVSSATATIIMFSLLVVLLWAGLPVVFALAGVGITSMLLLWGPRGLPIVATGAWAVMDFYVLIAVPLFVFMAMILQGSGVADALFKSMRLWFGGLNGGLAIAVVVICTIIAAMSGISSTGVVTSGILILPIMLKLGYDKNIALGPILAGGALGFLIPPSVSFVLYGALAEVSIGQLFLGGIVPGLMLSSMYILYIGIRCYLKPSLGPALPPEERGTLRDKLRSTFGFLPAVFLIIVCLVPIFLGIASPTEAASLGAVGSLVVAAINRRLNWPVIREACNTTFKVACMVMWIIIGAFTFKAVFIRLGGPDMVQGLVSGLHPLVTIFIMQLTWMFLGCFIDETPILLITLPVFLPVLEVLGFSKVWFGVLYIVNMQMAYLTPPFGFCLFYMRGVAPPEISMGDIYRSIIAFIPIQFTCLMLVLFFPQIALWLPGLVFD